VADQRCDVQVASHRRAAGTGAGDARPGGYHLGLAAAVAAFVQVTVVGDHDDGPVGRVGPGGHRRHQPPDPLVGGPDGGVVVRARTDQVARDVHRTEIDERCVRSVRLDD
jgi:hypothetical protein